MILLGAFGVGTGVAALPVLGVFVCVRLVSASQECGR